MNIYLIRCVHETRCFYHYIELAIKAWNKDSALERAREYCREKEPTESFYIYIMFTLLPDMDLVLINEEDGSK